ncbi:hypothetical protein SUGI_0418500 [Cryptomeria japonica]|uniref:BTB/POZ domain-containing protein At5g60050-like n=1 Tax=Cryptomeria japonica TaxID=3369 RepID=UPI002408E4A8|nr:BTB/POZ domain-containing protein At5g60050-like [Cryptomeria japonica]GLJ22252.1 hypothetical protein SUGI_0418500 [Cryptomeria japonica]
MAEPQLRFGDQSSANVKLYLAPSDEEEYRKDPVYLHSQILKRSTFFDPELSECSPLDKTTELWVTTPHNFDHYLKCIHLMYGETVNFSNIEECLAILSVASEMLVDDGINECMEYLEAVRWSPEEETQIRKILSPLELKLLPDLAARIHQEDDNHKNFVDQSIQEIVSFIKGGDYNLSTQKTVEIYLVGMLDGNTSRDVMDVCGRVILQEFKAAMDSRDLSSLLTLFQLIQHCEGEIIKAAMKAFCEDAQFTEFVKQQKNLYYSNLLGIINPNVLEILMGFMKATGDGNIIISRACRVSFLMTWVPIMGRLCCDGSRGQIAEVDKAVLNVVESLPPLDKKRICVVWAEVYRLNKINFATPFLLCLEMCNMPISKSVAK